MKEISKAFLLGLSSCWVSIWDARCWKIWVGLLIFVGIVALYILTKITKGGSKPEKK